MLVGMVILPTNSCAISVPLVMKSLVMFLIRKRQKVLQRHRSYDCKIDVDSGALISRSQEYALTESETECLRQYLHENLVYGFIRLLLSPAFSLLFLDPKKGVSGDHG